MIVITPTLAALFYLLLTLGGLTIAWIFAHLRGKKKKLIQNFEELYLCEYCHTVYLSDPSKPVHKCPECKSFNKNNKLRKRSD